MVNRRIAGYTLMEVVVAMAVFGIFLMILGVLTVEMRSQEKRLPVNFMRHPQVVVMLTKLRRDVLDAHGTDPYKDEFQGYAQSPKTLIIESVQDNGGVQTVIWDFREPGIVTRRSYNVGVPTDWVARGLPEDFSKSLEVDAVGTCPGRPWGVRIQARDGKGRLAIDQILQPRAHE